MNKQAIANEAKDLLKAIWHLKEVHCPQAEHNPLLCLNPEIACRHLGYSYSCISEFGDMRFTGGRIIGQLDIPHKRIIVAGNLPVAEQRFTAAHEIGHLIMHKDDGDMSMHRERFDFGNDDNRPPREKEADYFAACFLMPEKLVRQEFKIRFGSSEELRMTEQLAWQLVPTNPDQLLRVSKDSLERELAIARFQGTHRRFTSIADTFGVSAKAMARRLKELKLVRWP